MTNDLAQFTDSEIVSAIYKTYEEKEKHNLSRTYIGASVIGKECKRALWYAFRWVDHEQFEGRMLRLFQTGHLEEPRLVADLRATGATVWDCDPATGAQFSAQDHGGHMRGHCDGVAKNILGTDRSAHLLEFKTHSAKSFAELGKKGLIAAKPMHYWQMQWYMGRMQLKKGLYMAKNKDTDELYAQFVEFDPDLYKQIGEKAESVIFAKEPPEKLHNDSKYYVCNMCSFKGVCHGNKTPKFSCRTCVHATPERDGDGRWSCARHGDRDTGNQRSGCPDHLPLPSLINFATAIDAGESWIKMKRKDNGLEFIIGYLETDLPVYTSMELSAATDHNVFANQDIERIRQHFGATIEG
jgi:hypothetical protein